MSQGWIKLSRSLLDCWVWQGEPFTRGQAWVDLLLLADHKEHKMAFKGKMVECKRGDVNRSMESLSARWGWSRHKVRDFLRLLESDGMVTVSTDTKRTVISVENYSKYQGARTSKGHQKDGERTGKGQVRDTNKNDKNDKNDKTIYSELPEALVEPVKDFIEMRRKSKREMTDRAVRLMLTKLQKLGGGDTDTCVKILDQSIEHGWLSVYPLKEEKSADPLMQAMAEINEELYRNEPNSNA